MEQKLCQSCGMPIIETLLKGTNANGSMNEGYCCYCFANSEFISDCTIDEMIEQCIEFLDEFNKNAEIKLTKEEVITQMKVFSHS